MKNTKIKYEYKQFVLESQGKSESSFDAIRYAINLYEEFTNFANFKNFSKQDAIDFKKQLLESKSKSTARRILLNLKEFFKWVSYQAGFRKIKITDTEYFNLSLKDDRIAKSSNYKEFSSIEEIKKAIFSMSNVTDIEKRNQALIAFTLLTGIRISALVSLKIKQINLEKELVLQYGKDVDTKFGKTIYTFFFPVGNDVKQIVIDWIAHLKSQGYTENDPLFPKNNIECKDFSFVCTGLSKEHWQQTSQAREIFKDAFAKAQITCYDPHSFRRSLVHFGEQICTTPEQFKAWSQNLGHDNVGTTFTSYGVIGVERQGELVKGGFKKENTSGLDKNKLIEIIRNMD